MFYFHVLWFYCLYLLSTDLLESAKPADNYCRQIFALSEIKFIAFDAEPLVNMYF